MRGSSETRSKQIEATLRADLAVGVFGPGQRLPGEHALAQRFEASRNTVRRALAAMEASGLLRIVHGGGCYVCEEPIPYELGERTRFTENLTSQSLQGTRRLLSSRVEPAEPRVALALGLAEGASVVALELLVEADRMVVGHGWNYYDAARFRGIDDGYRRTGSFSRALRLFGVDDFRRRETSIIARMPTKAEARLLRQSRTQPVIEQIKLDVDADGDPLAYGVSVYAGERLRFVVRNPAPPAASG